MNLAGEQFRVTRMNKVFSVTDLSPEGMALRVLEHDDMRLFPVATRIEGTLNLHGEKHQLTAVVRHLGNDVIGCQFETVQENTRKALKDFLDPEALGKELRPIPGADSGTVWYRGPGGTSLLLLRSSDGHFRRISLFVLGSFMQWDEELGVTTGRARSDESSNEVRGIFRYETMLLDPDSAPDAGKLNIAKTVLLSSNLPQDLKRRCVRQFS
ncbi:MAG: hypothetical protein A2X94_15745 [Bdellovibrionales bacterium GWB1_55_8]|nr:MAG: hypothetical protein A2X94_15745 [Bdellovibrionales bacterium GWB1_55_8]